MSKTKELAAAGHALAKELHCAESATLVRELATQLDVQRVRADVLAAENVGLKESRQRLAEFIHEELSAGYPLNMDIETPATDAFLAEVRAHARNEGINYAAGRLAAAFNHGFIDKPMTEVCDVVRMILDTKEELANSTLPADDGLSGEYAEAFLEDSAAQLRKGVQS